MACQLGCPIACGILVPRPGIEPISLALEDRFLTTESPGKSHGKLFLEHFKNSVLCTSVSISCFTQKKRIVFRQLLALNQFLNFLYILVLK